MQKNETERPPPLAEVALGYGWTGAAEQGVSGIRSHVEERCRGETHATSTRAKRYGKSGVAIPAQRGGNRDGVLSTAGSKERVRTFERQANARCICAVIFKRFTRLGRDLAITGSWSLGSFVAHFSAAAWL